MEKRRSNDQELEMTDAMLQFGKPVCYPYIEHDESGSRYCSQKDCCCMDCVRDSESSLILSYNFYEFEERPLYFMKTALDAGQRMKLLRQFDVWYAETDQETTQYALEYAVTSRMLLDDAVILNPRYLALDEVLNALLLLLPDDSRAIYQSCFLKIQGGYTLGTEE